MIGAIILRDCETFTNEDRLIAFRVASARQFALAPRIGYTWTFRHPSKSVLAPKKKRATRRATA